VHSPANRRLRFEPRNFTGPLCDLSHASQPAASETRTSELARHLIKFPHDFRNRITGQGRLL